MIQPGLERIGQLVKNVQYPWKSIHVSGTNGKGSVCFWANMILSRQKIKCGKFTSPHLVDRWDCIQINNEPVNETLFRKVEKHYLDLSIREGINASPFEILTATAFHIFSEEEVKIGIVEVGMGGKLDATNILQNQAVSVVSKIARDHQNFLGNTMREITMHKAGILRPNVPFVVNKTNEGNVKTIINEYAEDIGAGPCIDLESSELYRSVYRKQDWKAFVAPMRPFQRDNAVLAVIAAREASKSIKNRLRDHGVTRTLLGGRHVRNPGRLELIKVQPVFSDPDATGAKGKRGRLILIDGAHNVDAAKSLKHHVELYERKRQIGEKKSSLKGKRTMQPHPVTWVLAMTDGKDARGYLEVLLEPGDKVITTTFGPVDGMPWVKPMDPKELLAVAKSAQPDITGFGMPKDGVLRSLCAAEYLTESGHPIVMTGSLYLAGEFHRELRTNNRNGKGWLKEPKYEEDRNLFKEIHKEERNRVNHFLSMPEDVFGRVYEEQSNLNEMEDKKRQKMRDMDRIMREKQRSIQEEIAALDREMELLSEEEKRISQEEWHTPVEASQSIQEEVSPEIDNAPEVENGPETNGSQQSPNHTLSVDPFAEITYAKYNDTVLAPTPSEPPESSSPINQDPSQDAVSLEEESDAPTGLHTPPKSPESSSPTN